MKKYEKPLIKEEEIEFVDVICVSVDESTNEGKTTDWGDIVNG